MLQKITVPLFLTSAISATTLRSDAERKKHRGPPPNRWPGRDDDSSDTVVDPMCCILGFGPANGLKEQFCLGANERNSAQDIKFTRITLAQCGSQVAATICPSGYEYGPVHGKQEFGYSCQSTSGNPYPSIDVEHGV